MSRRKLSATGPRAHEPPPFWSTTSIPSRQAFVHHVQAGAGHAIMSQLVASAVRVLGLTASLWNRELWWVLCEVPDVTSFEAEHGIGTDRQAYNERSVARVMHERRSVMGRHAGFCDWFVPVVIGDRVAAIIITGPFATERITADGIRGCWRRLSGRRAELEDPEFALYLTRALATLVLEGDGPARFQRLLGCFAGLLAGTGRADELANEADALRVDLEALREVERMWEAVEQMIDERSPRAWNSVHRAYERARRGLRRTPDQVLVGLFSARTEFTDPIEEAIRRERFQRRAVELARAIGDAAVGRVGDSGVVFLSAASGAAERRRHKVVELADRAAEVARKEFGLALHFGAAAAADPVPLHRSYGQARAAAEAALIDGRRIVIADAGTATTTTVTDLREQRTALARSLAERPGALRARFDRYVEAVAVQSGFHIETTRAHLDAAHERVTEAATRTGLLDEASVQAARDALDRAVAAAHNVSDLLDAYRRSVSELVRAIDEPAHTQQDRSLRRALEYIHEHYTEPLRFETVARRSGLAPKYFSRLFKRLQRKTFEEYVLGLRIERGKHLLSATEFHVNQIAKLAGFGSAQYFCRMFRRETGKTPLKYRSQRVYPSNRRRRGRTEKAWA